MVSRPKARHKRPGPPWLSLEERYKKPPTEDLRQQVIERMRELLVWRESDVFSLDGFETREEMLADLYDRQTVV